MINRAYLSNLSPRWPFDKQEAALRAALEGWPKGVTVLRDDLDARARRAHNTASLAARESLLRPSQRKDGETIYVASLAVLAWTIGDLMLVLTAAGMRGAAIVALDAGLTIPPSDAASVLHQAAVAFEAARMADIALNIGEAGAKKSAERRADAAKAKTDALKEFWRLPSAEHSTADLLAQFDVSMNTAKKHLGVRADAQRAYAGAQAATSKRKAKKEATNNG